jgi:glycosyltransferase involved in cell wall biosynthesis
VKIVVVHSFYSPLSPSGENLVVSTQIEALRSAGHEVLLVARYTDEEKKRAGYPLRAAARVATGFGPDPTEAVHQFRPDVINLHNLFPNFGTKWLKRVNVPVVATLHNFRPLCANGILYREGQGCTLCPDGKPLSSLIHRCYRNSYVATAALTFRNLAGPKYDPVLQYAKRLIVPSKRSYDVYARYGVQPSRMDLIPYFVDKIHHNVRMPEQPNRWLAVARLTKEKGIAQLLSVWPAGVPLDIVGDGPLLDDLVKMAPSGVEFLGYVELRELVGKLPCYTGLVFPSRWFEGLATIVLLALEAGLPIVALEGSANADLVARASVGRVYHDDDPAALARALLEVSDAGIAMRQRARAKYEVSFSRERWLSRIEIAYRTAIEQRHDTNETDRV